MRARLACALALLGVTACSGVRRAEAPAAPELPAFYSLARATAERPGDPQAWERLGWHLWLEEADPAGAEAALLRAVELDPRHGMSRFGVYLLAEDHGDLASAIDQAGAILREAPDFPLAEVLRRRLARLRELGLPAGAAARLKELMELPVAAPAGREAVEPFWSHYAAAILGTAPLAELRQCRRLAPRFAHAAAELAAAEPGLNERWHAYRAALALDPTHLRARVGLAELLAARGFTEEAEAELALAAETHPRSALVLLARARLARDRGHRAEAVRLCEEALAEAPGYEPAARLLLEAGEIFRTREAQAAQALALGLEEAQQAGRLEPAPPATPQAVERDESRLPIEDWLAQARKLRTDGFGSVVLYNYKAVEVLADGQVRTRRRIVAEVLRPGLEQQRWSFDYAPDELELTVLRAERREAGGKLLGLARKSDGPSPLLHESTARIYNNHHRLGLDFEAARPGDILDIEYETVGRGGTAGQFHGDLFPLGTGAPVVLGRYELKAPRELPLLVRAGGREPPQYVREEAGAAVLHRFEARDVPGTRVEPMGPSAIERLPFAVASTFQTWSELADWYLGLADLRGSSAVEPEIAALAASACEPSALHDLVRGQIRYLGFELGQYDFKPHAPADVLRARYGDCKDQSRLLVELLRACGIASEMVLVRTRTAGRVETDAPYPGIFNHAIVYVPSLDAYADPTAPQHRLGELPADLLDVPALHVVESAELGRTPASKPEDNTLEVRMRLRLTRQGAEPVAAQGRREVIHTGLFCPPLRAALAGQPQAIEALELGGAIPEAGDRKIQDRPGQVQLSYRLRFPLHDGELPISLRPFELQDWLQLTLDRTQSLKLRHPMLLRSRVELDVGALEVLPRPPEPVEMEVPGARYRFDARYETPQLLVITEELRLERLEVAASQVGDLRRLSQTVDKIQSMRLQF